jgi:Na+/pantothenate symporter
MEILIFLVIFSVLIAVWASSWGRNGFGWFLLAAFISPLIAGVILLIAGKTVEKKAAEYNAIRSMRDD